MLRVVVRALASFVLLSGFASLPASAQVRLEWNSSPAPSVAGYFIHIGLATHAYTSRIDVGKQTGYMVHGLAPGQTYFFVVTAYDASLNESSHSNEVSATIGPAPPPPSFADVPANHWAHEAIEAVAFNSITLGCATNPVRFCPDGDVGRDEMAVFLERATRGLGYTFAPTGDRFADVPLGHWAIGPIEQLYTDGITLGCAASPLRFCPDGTVTRAEMAIFLLRARFGAGFDPGPPTGTVFFDVPANHWAAAWIEAFAARGYTLGCGTSPSRFCPNAVVTRASMAVFLRNVFGLQSPPS